MKNSKYLKITVFVLIIIIAIFFRFFKLDSIPPSLNWDEVSAGYNAYTISHWGKDESGAVMLVVFRSFLDDKHPVHIYVTAILVTIFGLSDFVVRSSGALFGVLSVIIIYFLAKEITKSELVGLVSAFFLSISPYNIHFSRGLWETNFALFFYMLGIWAFLKGVGGQQKLLVFSMISFGLSILSYHSSKIIVPPTIFLLFILNLKELKKYRKAALLSLLTFGLFIGLMVVEPRLLGLARVSQTKIADSEISGNYWVGYGKHALTEYLKHFQYNYLFVSGDQSPRNSTKNFGQFYILDLPLWILGLISLSLYRKKSSLLILAWIVLSPVASSFSSHGPNATRALFMMGSLHILSAVGFAFLITQIRNRNFQIAVTVLLIFSFGYLFKSYLDYYYGEFPKKEAIEWQYGMREVVLYNIENPGYNQVYMTDIRSQPYIFFLYYLKYPLPKFLKTVKYNEKVSRSHNLVESFDRFNFGNWDPIESAPIPGTLYIVGSSHHDGLRHKLLLPTRERVDFPDGSSAFYLVGAY